jgi:hypothetical protein
VIDGGGDAVQVGQRQPGGMPLARAAPSVTAWLATMGLRLSAALRLLV